MRMAVEARRLPTELGLLDTHVFFNEGWVPYDERQNFLLDADVGVCMHLDHVETAFSFRTRVLDYLWASLPVVTTAGDAMATLVTGSGAGLIVPPEDPGAIESALDRLLSDPDLAGALPGRERGDGVRAPLVSGAGAAPRVLPPAAAGTGPARPAHRSGTRPRPGVRQGRRRPRAFATTSRSPARTSAKGDWRSSHGGSCPACVARSTGEPSQNGGDGRAPGLLRRDRASRPRAQRWHRDGHDPRCIGAEPARLRRRPLLLRHAGANGGGLGRSLPACRRHGALARPHPDGPSAVRGGQLSPVPPAEGVVVRRDRLPGLAGPGLLLDGRQASRTRVSRRPG